MLPSQNTRANAGSTRTSAVYRDLRQDILRGRLSPSAKLLIDEIGQRYGVTSTPIREALNQLVTEGFVQKVDQKGFFVAQVSRRELTELTNTRCWVESIALRESLANRTPQWEEQLILAGHRLSRINRSSDPEVFRESAPWEDTHKQFHMALLAACPSRWLLEFCSLMTDHAARYRYLSMSLAYPGRDVTKEHKALIDAAIDGPPARAIEMLTEHYRTTADIIIRSNMDLPD
ncbi:GntR family transcriptional regulator [Paraburkholderia caballeronis]|uniref:GntR family transcriptional regulator n=1 Tax=Paraburkholderia caballeronis TaxID=416943 RepID=UPI001064D0D9|nr:GntR family transcriptional regulator [Paraburkholderia caballeronis]TDV33631.1 GntR family transcriptional regulator [Paraburkholderia caballeronis]